MRSYNGVRERKVVRPSSRIEIPEEKAIRNNDTSGIKFLTIWDRCISNTLFWCATETQHVVRGSQSNIRKLAGLAVFRLGLLKVTERNCWNKQQTMGDAECKANCSCAYTASRGGEIKTQNASLRAAVARVAARWP
jgi:hypothetical protein